MYFTQKNVIDAKLSDLNDFIVSIHFLDLITLTSGGEPLKLIRKSVSIKIKLVKVLVD